MIKFLKSLFERTGWLPTFIEGDEILVKTNELKKYIGRDALCCKVLKRDSETRNGYYHVNTSDTLDHKGNPMEFYIPETSAIKRIAPVE
jgi:hypothetical protein